LPSPDFTQKFRGDAKVGGYVFEGYILFKGRILLSKLFVSVFCCNGEILNDAILVRDQRVLKKYAKVFFKFGVPVQQLIHIGFEKVKDSAVG
jgi:hypothetical protein